MNKNTFITLVLAFLLIGCYTVSLPEKMPEDFNITYSILGESYDSKKETFTRQYYPNDSTVLHVKLTELEKKRIYEVMKKNRFMNLSSVVDESSLFIKPTGQIEISISFGSTKKEVTALSPVGRRVRRFSPVEDVIREIIYNRNEVRDLPPNGFGYE